MLHSVIICRTFAPMVSIGLFLRYPEAVVQQVTQFLCSGWSGGLCHCVCLAGFKVCLLQSSPLPEAKHSQSYRRCYRNQSPSLSFCRPGQKSLRLQTLNQNVSQEAHQKKKGFTFNYTLWWSKSLRRCGWVIPSPHLENSASNLKEYKIHSLKKKQKKCKA